MHGIIFAELRKYVDAKLGTGSWQKLLAEAGTGERLYLAVREYPDEDAVALVSTASKMTGIPAQDILEDFGLFIAPSLLNMYAGLIKAEWKTLDLIENTEENIHKVVRFKNPGAKPPQLKCDRTSSKEVVITYRSKRKMCSVAKGIAKGVAKHYRENVTVSESSCMLKGNAECKISVRT